MTRNPWLEIVIPTRNRRDALRENIPDIVRQANETGAIVSFYDNASTDGTDGYLGELAATTPCVRYRRNSENIGLDRNMLLGVEHARADYVYWLGDDDVLRPDALTTIQSLLKEHNPDLLLLSMISPPDEWDHSPRPQCTFSDPQAFFSQCCYCLPFGTQVFKTDLVRDQLQHSDRFLGTYHAYSGLLFDGLAELHRRGQRVSVVWHREPLVKSTNIPKAWAADKADVYLVGLPKWFDVLHPLYAPIKETKRLEFTQWPDYLNLLQTLTASDYKPDILVARLQSKLADTARDLGACRMELADASRLIAEVRDQLDESRTAAQRAEGRLLSLLTRWTKIGWTLMPWTKPSWWRAPLH